MSPGSEVIFQVHEEPDGGFWAQALGHDIFTQADDLEGLKASVLEAVRVHFEPLERPAMVRLHLVKDVLLAV
jgi:hypothetical protein